MFLTALTSLELTKNNGNLVQNSKLNVQLNAPLSKTIKIIIGSIIEKFKMGLVEMSRIRTFSGFYQGSVLSAVRGVFWA